VDGREAFESQKLFFTRTNDCKLRFDSGVALDTDMLQSKLGSERAIVQGRLMSGSRSDRRRQIV
jgi:hypothetical protein